MDIRQKLNIELESPYWEEAVKKAQAMPAVPNWLTKEYVCSIDEEFELLGDLKEPIAHAAELVAANEDLCMLAKILYAIIDYRTGYSNSFTAFELPKAPEGAETLGYDYVALLPVLGYAKVFAEEMTARGLPHQVIKDSFFFFKYRIEYCAKEEGKLCYNARSFSAYPIHVYNNNIFVGRLRYEIHKGFDRNVKVFADANGNVCILMCGVKLHAKGHILGVVGYTDEEGAYDADFVETDEYYEGYAVDGATGLAQNTRTRLSKKDWKVILQSGDTVLKVHIRGGEKLLKADCDDSYARAEELFKKCFPEHDFKGFVCNTWLLCPVMGRFLKPTSNIMQFQEKYNLFPANNNAPDVFGYVYGLNVASAADVDPETLPEENSMQRGVKQMLKEGTYMHQFNGFIPFK